MNERIYLAAVTLWDYLQLHEAPRTADLLLVLGSIDDRVAIYAAQLSRQYVYATVMFTGGSAHHNDILATKWHEKTEAEHFFYVYKAAGGDINNVLLESQAQNTGENAVFSAKLLLTSKKELPQTIQIVTKPYMERRAHATFDTQWPETPKPHFFVTSPRFSFDDYCANEQPMDKVIHIMVGDLERIIEYPNHGLQSKQIVPSVVLSAYDVLIRAGFTNHSLK